MKKCSIFGCNNPYKATNFCSSHYNRHKRYGDANISKGLSPTGRSKFKEYRAWQHMKSRCYVQSDAEYKNYGARGIKVCKRWLESFDNFIKDMGYKPNDDYSLDRINNDGNYTPTNCRWTTKSIQNINKRSKTNTSGVVGVRWLENRGKWVSYICVDGVGKTLGYYKDMDSAINARKEAEHNRLLIYLNRAH